MPWDAKTNTGEMKPGVVLALIETPIGGKHITQPPPTGSTVGVDLGGGTNPVQAFVAFGWVDDAVYRMPDGRHWRLAPGRQPDVMSYSLPSGARPIFWQVTALSSAAEAAALIASKVSPSLEE